MPRQRKRNNIFKNIADRIGGVFNGSTKNNPARRTGAPSPAVAAGRRYKKRRTVLRVKNKKRIIIAASSLAAIVIVAVVLMVITTAKPDTVSTDTMMTEAAMANVPMAAEPTPTAGATLAMPVYAPVSITAGMSAAVVVDIQQALMDLGYMGVDEPDGVFGTTTKEAVERFQTQHEIEADGTIDDAAYLLLISDEAQEYTLSVGIENPDVLAMQERLSALDYMSSSTGYYGDETETAVLKFQKMNGLTEDGKIGGETRELLYSSDAVANAYSVGEKNDDILAYQNKLRTLGYMTTEPDGVFGADTKTAVQRFQDSSGLIADGYIGPQTRTALMSDDAQGNALAIGAEGNDVTRVQERLKDLDYMSKATGYFGSDTDTAVRSFQHNNKLSVDGKVGSQTMNALLSSDAKKSTGVAVTGANVESFIAMAESKLGSRYVLGGKGPTVFDCSGFAYWCLNQVGVKQGYMTSYTWRSSTKYTRIDKMSDLKRGDIIIYYGHVGICLGNGWMIDASSSKGKVVKRKYWSSGFYCGFRVF